MPRIKKKLTPEERTALKGPPNQGSLRAYLQNFTKEAIDEIIKVMRNSKIEKLRMEAAKIIVDKSIPDIKAVELNGGVNADGSTEPVRLLVNAGNGFIPATFTLQGSSNTGFTTTTPEVQGSDLAQKSVENNDSNNGNSETGSPA